MLKTTDSRSKRKRYVIAQAEMDVELGVLLAAVDFEWTCRRCILLFSGEPTQVLKEKFTSAYRAFKGLEAGWTAEVLPRLKNAKFSLRDVFDVWQPLQGIQKRPITWSQICDAMACRNVIVHGTESTISRKYGRMSIYVLESACDVLDAFVRAENSKLKLNGRVARRRKKTEATDISITVLEKRNVNLAVKFGPNHWINRRFGW